MRNRFLRLSCLTAAATIAMSAAQGVDLVVAGSDDKAAVVTVGTNCDYSSIQKAIDNVADEGTVIVKPDADGVYNELLIIDKPLTLMAEGNVVISGKGFKPNNDKDAIITVTGNGVEISGFELSGLKTGEEQVAAGIRVKGGASNVTIDSCKICDMGVGSYSGASPKNDDFNAHGIIVSSHKENETIKNVTISNCELTGLKLGQSEALVLNGNVEGFEIYNNYVHDNDNIGIDIIGYEENNFNEWNRARSGFIHNNRVENISTLSNPTYKDGCSAGIYVDGGYDVDIYENYIENCNIGVSVSSEWEGYASDKIDVYNNYIYNDNDATAWVGLCIGGSEKGEDGFVLNCNIYNNTVYNVGDVVLTIQQANSNTNKIYNNILASNEDNAIYWDEEEYVGDNSDNLIYENYLTGKKLTGKGDGFKDNEYVSLKSLELNGLDEKSNVVDVTSNLSVTEGAGVQKSFKVGLYSSASVVDDKEAENKDVETSKADDKRKADDMAKKAMENNPLAQKAKNDQDKFNAIIGKETNTTVGTTVNANKGNTTTKSLFVNPSDVVYSNNEYYGIEEPDDGSVVATYKKDDGANWECLMLDISEIDTDKYAGIKMTVNASRNGMILGVSTDSDDPDYFINHYESEGKLKKGDQVVYIDFSKADLDDNFRIWLDATNTKKLSGTQKFIIKSLEFVKAN